MNIQKFIAIVAAIAINCAVLAWFHAWTSSVVASATVPSASKVVTLPTINVHPSAAQLRAAGRGHAGAASGGGQAGIPGNDSALAMPYYSFAAQPTSRDAG